MSYKYWRNKVMDNINLENFFYHIVDLKAVECANHE